MLEPSIVICPSGGPALHVPTMTLGAAVMLTPGMPAAFTAVARLRASAPTGLPCQTSTPLITSWPGPVIVLAADKVAPGSVAVAGGGGAWTTPSAAARTLAMPPRLMVWPMPAPTWNADAVNEPSSRARPL